VHCDQTTPDATRSAASSLAAPVGRARSGNRGVGQPALWGPGAGRRQPSGAGPLIETTTIASSSRWNRWC